MQKHFLQKSDQKHELLYRQQFIIGPRNVKKFTTWKNLKISETLFITSHPDLSILHISNAEESLTLIGYLIDSKKPQQKNSEILNRLLLKNTTFRNLISSTYDLCGNWVLISKKNKEIILFHDCTGAKSVYYSDSDKFDELWIASQPRLIALVMDVKEDKNAIDFIVTQKSKTEDYWWPGEKSPYSDIKALIPNHYFDIQKRQKFRYWPDQELAELNENDAVDKISMRLKGIMLAASNRFDLALALSSGLDSRVMLAASKDIRDKICVYNGKRPEMPYIHPDVIIPKRLTKKMNMEYHFIPQTKNINEEFYKAYQMNAPYPFSQIINGLESELNYFDRRKVGATGNILETGRFFYKIFDPAEHIPTGEYLAKITKMKDSPFAVEAFDDWFKSIDDVYNLNIYDLFYWEQRCGRWLSNNCLVFSMAWKEVLFPFNCRNLLIDILSVSGIQRMPTEYQFYLKLIKNMWPEILKEPINPKMKLGLINRIEEKVKKILH